jgi:hypothetical protein
MAVRWSAPCARRPFPQEDSWYSFLLEAIVRLEGLGQLKNPNDLIGNRIRDIRACSIVPQPATNVYKNVRKLFSLNTCCLLEGVFVTQQTYSRG